MGREGSGQVGVCRVGGGWRGGACRGGGGGEEEGWRRGGKQSLGLRNRSRLLSSKVNSLAARSPEGRDAENPLHHGASLFPDAWPGMFFPLDLWWSWLRCDLSPPGTGPAPRWQRASCV